MANRELHDALESYDRTHPVISALMGMRRELSHPVDSRKRDRMVFYDDQDRPIYETDVETLAFYYPQVGLYAWSWAIPSRRQSTTFLSRQVLQYCLNNDVSLYTRTILTTGRSIIRDVTQVDINLALAITLIRRPYILPQLFTTPYREDQPEAEPSLKIVSYSLLLDDLPLEEWCRTGIPPSPSTHTPPATASTP